MLKWDLLQITQKLNTVDLSGTQLLDITFHMFTGIHYSLEVLNLLRIPIQLDRFQNIEMPSHFSHLIEIHVTRPEICCILTNVMCKSDKKNNDIFGTSKNIISKQPLVFVASCYALLILVLNSASSLWYFNLIPLYWLIV